MAKKPSRKGLVKQRKLRDQQRFLIADKLDEADYQYGEEEWGRVVKLCRSVLKIQENNIPAMKMLADAYYFLDNKAQLDLWTKKLSSFQLDNREVLYSCLTKLKIVKNFEALVKFGEEYLKRFSRHKSRREVSNLVDYAHSQLRLSAAAPARKTKKKANSTKSKAVRTMVTPSLSQPEKPQSASKAPLRKPDLPILVPEIKMSFNINLGPLPAPETAPASELAFRLRQNLRYEHIQMQNEFEELTCLSKLRGIVHFGYQEETVRKVLKVFRGRVLLADEVGLGKTIEAGMVVKEYLMRGMIKSVLILCPPSLVLQWTAEMRSKFGIKAHTQSKRSVGDKAGFWSNDIVIASISTAKNKANSRLVTGRVWDMVVVDEAHSLKNRATKAWKLVNEIKKKFLLLLSATPVQNNLVELYNLITLLKPGTFPAKKDFLAQYCVSRKTQRVKEPEKLRMLMREVMVRNTRAGCGVPFPKRFAATLPVEFSPSEFEVYSSISEALRRLTIFNLPKVTISPRLVLERAGAHLPLAAQPLRTLAGALESQALEMGESGLAREADTARDLAERLGNLPKKTSKIKRMEELLRDRAKPAIVFCRHSATVIHLGQELRSSGFACALFHGGLSQADRAVALKDFCGGNKKVLISSETGGEGHNLQFCDTIINFDLPWNPMRIEQRIGRIHRIGQKRDVFIFNLCQSGTVEEKILKILEGKIRMFELVIGEVDSILGHLENEGGFSDMVLDLWVNNGDTASRDAAFEELGTRLEKLRDGHLEAGRIGEALFGQEMEA